MKLLSPGHTNTKLSKGGGLHDRFLNFILHLAPADLSGHNTCPYASAGCKSACLNTAGRGAFNSIQTARINKTLRLFNDRESFMSDLFKDLNSVLNKAKKLNKKAVVRLNGTSDLSWELYKITGTGVNIFECFPEIQFYDYTKSVKRALKSVNDPLWPKNYHLTFSRSETNDSKLYDLLQAGVNVAVVFNSAPEFWRNYRVIDGDSHDFRFLDGRDHDGTGLIISLTAKGRAKKDKSGFVL